MDQSPVDLATLATIPAIPPGERVQATFEHDFSNDGDVYAINYELTGHGETLPATAYVTVFAR